MPQKDEFGGIAVDEPSTDEFGGLAVDDREAGSLYTPEEGARLQAEADKTSGDVPEVVPDTLGNIGTKAWELANRALGHSVTPQDVADARDVLGEWDKRIRRITNPLAPSEPVTPIGEIPTRPPTTGEQITAGVQNVVNENLATPLALAFPVANKFMPAPVAKAIGVGFAANAVAHLPEAAAAAGEASVTGNPYEKTKAYGNLAASLAIPAAVTIPEGIGLKRKIQGFAETPPGGETIRAEGPSTPAEQTLIKQAADINRRLGLAGDVEVVSETAAAGTSPDIAYAEGGKIKVNLPELRKWLARMPEGQRANAIKSLLTEEGIHAKAQELLGEDALGKLWTDLSKPEQAMLKRSYFGKEWRGAEDMTDSQMGHEYLRRVMQWGMKVSPREVAGARGNLPEFLTQKGIDVALKAIDMVRSGFTKQGNSALARTVNVMEQNLQMARDSMPSDAVAASAKPSVYEPTTEGDQNASSEPKAAEVYGDVQPQSGEGQGKVPGQEGSGGIQPQTDRGVQPAEGQSGEVPLKGEKLSAKQGEDYPVEVENPDGTKRQGFFNGYYDMRPMEPDPIVSLGFKLPNGKLSHGALEPGQKLNGKIPTFEEWNKSQEKLSAKGPKDEPEEHTRLVDNMLKMSPEEMQAFGAQPGGGTTIAYEIGRRAKTQDFVDSLKEREQEIHKRLSLEKPKTDEQVQTWITDSTKAQLLNEAWGFATGIGSGGEFALKSGHVPKFNAAKATFHDLFQFLKIGDPAFEHYSGELGDGRTGYGHDLGSKATTPQDVAKLTTLYDSLREQFADAKKVKDYIGMQKLQARSQATHEAIQAATGKNLAGEAATSTIEALKKAKPGYEPPVKAAEGSPTIDPLVEAVGEKLSARNPITRAVEDLNRKRKALATILRASENRNIMDQTIDGADNKAAELGQQMGNRLKIGTDKISREATMAVVEANGNRAKLADFRRQSIAGGNKDAEAAVNYADANWTRLQADAAKTKAILDAQITAEQGAGIATEYRDAYVPHIYDQDLWMGGSRPFVIAGGTGLGTGLGSGFKKGRTFPTIFDAIEQGYTPKTMDVADLVEHRVKAGQKIINRKDWGQSLASINDPTDGKPLAAPLIRKTRGPGQPSYEVAPPGYLRREILPGVALGIHEAYDPLFKALTGESAISSSTPGRMILEGVGGIKHGLLLFDTFHASRIYQKLLTLAPGQVLSGKAGYRRGQSLLEFADSDLNAAVAANLITPEIANWVRANRANSRLLLDAGLNVGRIQEGLYTSLVRKIPGLGTFNKWVFEKLTRGALMEAGLIELERVSAARPGVARDVIARQVARNLNTYFGNLGRQGFFKSSSMRDIARMVALAPQWVESMARTELKGAAQAVKGVTYDPVVHKTLMVGSIGKGVAQGLLAYLVGTQILNYITRGHSTFENPEDHHKLDAWIPGPKGSHGFFLSPFAVVAELTHDMLRYSSKEPTLLDAAARIASNKASPLWRAGKVLLQGKDYDKKNITGTWNRVKAAGFAMAPTPIILSPIAKGSASYPGQMQRQITASMGFKTEPAPSAAQQIADKAKRFMADKPRKIQTMELSDEPAFYKLRDALRKDDTKGAKEMIETLRETHTDSKFMQAMRGHLKRPFTESRKDEIEFRDSLNPKEQELYDKARNEQRQEFDKFQELWDQRK